MCPEGSYLPTFCRAESRASVVGVTAILTDTAMAVILMMLWV